MTAAGNPLVAAASPDGPSPWAGVWIAEDINAIVSGVRGGSWIDGTIGGVSAGLDALAVVSDPVGALLQYGVAWLIEHVRPLSEALDWLAGDPAEIAAHAQTWRNAATRLQSEADDLARSVAWDVSEWSGTASDTYRAYASGQVRSLETLAVASDGMALITESAGLVIATVRELVRDAVATVVSRLIVYAAELLGTLGTAAPLVAEQVATLCASWGAKIANWLRGLIATLRKLADFMRRLGDRINELMRREGGPSGSSSPEPSGGQKGSSAGGEKGPPPWRAPDDLPGPARGRDIRLPNSRHTVSGSRTGEVKNPTTIILRGNESAVREDVRQLAAGNAKFDGDSNTYVVNGRSYGIHENGTVFPVSGPGLVVLNGTEYTALQMIGKRQGDVAAVREFEHDPRFLNNPDAIVKAKAIYDGTYGE
ncbi:WXG100 family type VII secretion target [Actinoplanes sp. NPDC049265]|uniref:WXG100 family type VII secretion target n=1 Tax=Actinoplanes sp. NPDC049265 TaxID=3363902 RepID=UPI003715F5D9